MSTEEELRARFEYVRGTLCLTHGKCPDRFSGVCVCVDNLVGAIGIPLPVLAWAAANPEAAKGLASGEMVAVSVVPRPLAEWHEDMGPALWWRFPIEEAPFVGTPLGSDWTWNYYTHFTPCPEAAPPSGKAQGETADDGVRYNHEGEPWPT